MATAVIPCGGTGARLASVTPDIPKELLPVGGKPLLQWTLEEAAAAGLARAVVVTSPEKPQIAEFLAARPPVRLSVSVVVQPEPRGLGDALACARPAVGPGSVAVLLPDNVFGSALPPAIAPVLAAHRRTGLACVLLAEIAAREAPTRGATGRVRCRPRADGLYQIEALADKGPRTARFDTGGAPAALTAVGRMVFAADLFRQLEHARRGLAPGAELDDVPVLQAFAAEGRLVGVLHRGSFYDVGVPEGYRAALAALS